MNDVIIKKYIQAYYGDVKIVDFQDKNNCFDIVLQGQSSFIKVEVKDRIMLNKNLVEKYDLLIEIIQGMEYLQIPMEYIQNQTVDSCFNMRGLNIAIGWFYKCDADRLFYTRSFEGSIFDLIDIDFKLFKNWFMDHAEKFSLNYSGKTTKTINAIVPIKTIPVPFFRYFSKQQLQEKKIA